MKLLRILTFLLVQGKGMLWDTFWALCPFMVPDVVGIYLYVDVVQGILHLFVIELIDSVLCSGRLLVHFIYLVNHIMCRYLLVKN